MPIKTIVYLVVAALTIVVLTFGVSDYMRLRKAAAQNELRGQVITTTAHAVVDGDKADEQRVAVDVSVRDARSAYSDNLEKAKHDDPNIASRIDRVVPDRLRELARERRLARERSTSNAQPTTPDNARKAATKR